MLGQLKLTHREEMIMMIQFIKHNMALALMLFGLASAASVSAHDGASGVVKARMDAMSDMAAAMKAMAKVVKGKQAYEPQLFIDNGTTIVGHSAMLVDLFPAGSKQGKSESKLLIWQQWDDFANLAQRTKIAAQGLVDMAQQGSELRPLKKQFANLGGSCKACHQDYRQKK